MTTQPPWLQAARQLTGTTKISVGERVQSLWSGYGEIVRACLDGTPAIIKHVTPPSDTNHPRGWSTDRSHARKLRSYQVELAWYQQWGDRCSPHARIPGTIAATTLGNTGWLFVLEDLDHSGFPVRHQRLDESGVRVCLNWLAGFHAAFLGESPAGLWQTGTYWHLDTRPDEFDAMPAGPLKDAAHQIDQRLGNCRYKTFVHGDAKVANFCFAPDNTTVAAVDFQYVGAGCGIKDVAYFLGSCLDEHGCQRHAPHYLDFYFTALRNALNQKQPDVDPDDLEAEWRQLFPLAWTDFYRFLAGWCPSHPKMNPYSERLAQQVITNLSPNPKRLTTK
ncbi:MAG: DUF1679 domain-containing protein [Verrucomicrobiales bacterium]|nr:DUF1679 domain-containing protein [Verrucomicrobiales bacterium]